MQWPMLHEHGIRLIVIPGIQSNDPVRLWVRGADLSGNEDFTPLGDGWSYNKGATRFTLADCQSWFPKITGDWRNFVKNVDAASITLTRQQLDAEMAALTIKTTAVSSTASIKDSEKESKSRKGKNKINDTGEKIGGARKDFYGNALTIDDLAEMTEVEKTNAVQRDNIWPALSPDAARKAGFGAEALYAIRIIRRNMNGDIKKQFNSPDKFDADARFYIDTVTHLRDAVMAEPYPKKQGEVFQRFCCALQERDIIEYEVDPSIPYWMKKMSSSTEWGDASRLFGGKFCKLSFDWHREVSSTIERKTHFYWETKKESELTPGEIEDRLWQKLFARRAPTPREKQKQDDSKDVDADGSVVPHFAKLERTAEDYRQGADKTADELMFDFGFRAVEFGNWLPQAERQEVINRAYDSFALLADVMDISRRMIGFEGELAVSFGARGRSGAAAHFEPGRKVLHLTRLSGAGALAHEWGHGFDFMVGKKSLELMQAQGMEVKQSGKFFATEFMVAKVARAGRKKHYGPCNQYPIEFLRAERFGTDRPDEFKKMGSVASKLSAVIARAYVRSPDVEDAVKKAKASLPSRHNQLENALYKAIIANGNKNYPQEYKEKLAMLKIALAEGDESAQAFIRDVVRDHKEQAAALLCANSLLLIEKKLRMWYADELESKEPKFFGDFMPTINYVTAFCNGAVHLDDERGREYYRKDVEMFARTFESWVFDKLAAEGWRDDFLVRADRAENREDKRYPHGKDRVALAAAMSELQQTFKSACAIWNTDVSQSEENENSAMQMAA